MNPMTIQCVRCSACLVLGLDVLERLRGRTGRLPCHACGEKFRLDGTRGDLQMVGARPVQIVELELDEPASARGEQLSLLPPPPDLRDEPEEESSALRSLPPRPPARSSLRPPRPSGLPRPQLPSNPFDELGTLAPVVPLQGVRLTADGRLVNRADEASAKKPRSRMRTWAPLAAAGLLATGFASARVGSMLPLRSVAVPAEAVPAEAISAAAVPGMVARPARAVSLETPAPAAPALPTNSTSSQAPRVADALTSTESAVSGSASKAGDHSRAGGLPRVAPADAFSVALEPSDAAVEPPVVSDESASEPSSNLTSGDAAPEAAVESGTMVEDALLEAPEGPAFSREAATVALQHAEAEALSCRQPGDPAGSARVVITFAPSGRVTSANVGGAPFAGTRTGGCIAGRFRAATVPAFVGGHVTVSKTISVQ